VKIKVGARPFRFLVDRWIAGAKADGDNETMGLPAFLGSLFERIGRPRVRICPECGATNRLPVWHRKPGLCVRCYELFDPAECLWEPAGVVTLTDDRYRTADVQPLVKLIAMVFLLAIKDRATEVRLEPGQEEPRLCYRCDGRMFDMVPPPRHLCRSIIRIVKAMANLESTTCPTSQPGRLVIKVADDLSVDAQVRTEPAETGEALVVTFPS
jgi:hypothetical protein